VRERRAHPPPGRRHAAPVARFGPFQSAPPTSSRWIEPTRRGAPSWNAARSTSRRPPRCGPPSSAGAGAPTERSRDSAHAARACRSGHPHSPRRGAPVHRQADRAVKTLPTRRSSPSENVRLFTELQERNRDITEAPGAADRYLRDLASHLELADRRPTGAERGGREWRHASARWTMSPSTSSTASICGWWRTSAPAHSDRSAHQCPARGHGWRALLNPPAAGHVSDLMSAEVGVPRRSRPGARYGNPRTLAVPLLREGQGTGFILLRRADVRRQRQARSRSCKASADQAGDPPSRTCASSRAGTRTHELTRSVGRASSARRGRPGRSSSLDLETVLATIASRARELSSTDGGAIYEYDEQTEEVHLRATQNFEPEFAEVLATRRSVAARDITGRMVETREVTQIRTVLEDSCTSPRCGTRCSRRLSRPAGSRCSAEDRINRRACRDRKTPGEFRQGMRAPQDSRPSARELAGRLAVHDKPPMIRSSLSSGTASRAR